MPDFDSSEPVWKRAWRDTVGAVHSAWWFWGAEVAVAAAASVLAVSVYPDDASTLEQAAIQASFVVAGFVLVAFGLLISNLVALAVYHQRDDARLAWAREREESNKLRAQALTRGQLLEGRRRLGGLMSDAGDMLITRSTDMEFGEECTEFFGKVLELFRSESPVFDDSHEGRYYAARTEALRAEPKETVEGWRNVLQADLRCLNAFVSEVNAELNSIPR